MTLCLQKDPEQRPSAEELLQNPFVTGASEDSSNLRDMVLKRKAKVHTMLGLGLGLGFHQPHQPP